MRKFYFILILVAYISCVSQESQQEKLKGDWYPIYQKGYLEEYFEMFIDEDKIYYHLPTGMRPAKRYKIENEYLFIENFSTGKLEKKGRFQVNKDSLIVEDFGVKVICLRIKSDSKLSSIVKDSLDDECYNKKFEERMFKWLDIFRPE